MVVTLDILAFKNRRPLVVREDDKELDIIAVIARHCRCNKQDFTLTFDRPFDTNVKVSGFVDGDQAYLTSVHKSGTGQYQRCQRAIYKGFDPANAKTLHQASVAETKQHVTEVGNSIKLDVTDLKRVILAQQASSSQTMPPEAPPLVPEERKEPEVVQTQVEAKADEAKADEAEADEREPSDA